MDIQEAWKGLGENKEADINADFLALKSTGPMTILKQKLLKNIYIGAPIVVLYIIVLFYIRNWQVVVLLLVCLLYSAWVFWKAFLLYRNIPDNLSSSESLLSVLEMHYNNINNWIIMQQKVGIFIYPFSVTAGFLLGGLLSSGKSIESFLYNWKVVISLLVTVIILMPISFYAAKYTCKVSFGKYLAHLKENIDILKSLE